MKQVCAICLNPTLLNSTAGNAAKFQYGTQQGNEPRMHFTHMNRVD